MGSRHGIYIDGKWIEDAPDSIQVINPATERPVADVSMGDASTVDMAVEAARRAFQSFSQTSKEERLDLLRRVVDVYEKRSDDLVDAVIDEVGAPVTLAAQAQVPAGLGQFTSALDALDGFPFQEDVGSTAVVYEAIGVCGLITPWNWPLLLIGAKVAPALASGCTVVLKPSELTPLNAIVLTEIMEEAGVPSGVFNLVTGDGPTVGAAIANHPDIDMISFTGSTRTGVEIARAAAPTVKRVHQELGGKSANIILDDADLRTCLAREMGDVYANSGQSCNAGSRWLVPTSRLDQVIEIAREAAEGTVVGDPRSEDSQIGPLVSKAQYDKVQRLLQSALDEGASLVAGGLGKPEGLDRGYYARPTVLAGVTNDMTIAREEIFGPVITLTAYETEDEAVELANDTVYGLSGFVNSSNQERARRIARQMRTGMVHLNGAGLDFAAPFGGYKQSGNGREYGVYGLREYLEAKSIFGYHI